jgi:DNA-binding response OmpR family regulator
MGQSPFILLVEDEAFIALMLQDLLESAGFAVVAAQNAGEARAVIANRAAEICGLVTDIRLGGTSTDGWALARHAREQIPDVPIAYMSGGADDHLVMGVPNSILLHKPFTATHFLGAISALIDKSSACVAR